MQQFPNDPNWRFCSRNLAICLLHYRRYFSGCFSLLLLEKDYPRDQSAEAEGQDGTRYFSDMWGICIFRLPSSAFLIPCFRLRVVRPPLTRHNEMTDPTTDKGRANSRITMEPTSHSIIPIPPSVPPIPDHNGSIR